MLHPTCPQPRKEHKPTLRPHSCRHRAAKRRPRAGLLGPHPAPSAEERQSRGPGLGHVARYSPSPPPGVHGPGRVGRRGPGNAGTRAARSLRSRLQEQPVSERLAEVPRSCHLPPRSLHPPPPTIAPSRDHTAPRAAAGPQRPRAARRETLLGIPELAAPGRGRRGVPSCVPALLRYRP